ncbi:hypothetical protein TREMEDRAFT_68250 [Tremella mesenterica DSM 1558]|uniref:uncharacterized protein n=1 Tax=Tremella mesenterica (strain ATCC 24925 / CBS 8224 / DSM 1558 / NBRC 9311 / NRRL Y-6157 / RJB 2259-6 / UBC 559-6) TaxID=578456 RepID=UPI0003F4A3AF|nr:uncharacterized protein TREMEDRAFT_68250 [Tremella mesenterica DSM 1558]EIW70863.1 hypothetical protein TREMEDRAFT_68250 [Tremella mesenterica DSM 1558]
MVADTAYYDLLEIHVTADEGEIKRAYKRKAMQHHPDKNPDDPLAHETFQKIGQAYETLSDPNLRESYDKYGPDGPSSSHGADMDDLFASMFGASFTFDSAGPSRRSKPSRGQDTNVRYEVSLEEVYKGKTVRMSLERDRLCGGCRGSGARPNAVPVKCGTCEGKGSIYVQRHLGPNLVGRMKEECTACQGEGKRVRDRERCKRCKGAKVVKEKKQVEFDIKPGTLDGERIALRGEGDEASEIPPGDVIFQIRHRPHPLFRPRPSGRPHDLSMTLPLSLSEALLGFSRVAFVHLDGRGIRLVSPRGQRVIRPSEELVIKGEGLPMRYNDGKGDLWIKFEVEMPGTSWVARQDPEGSELQLPGPLGDILPLPHVVDIRCLLDP